MKNDLPLISVIIPVYNVEKYLDRCVNSVVNQTYKNLEIILVDDGSPDNCPSMCDGWAERDGRIKVIHKENSGPFKARIAGINSSTAEYLSFVDSDDFLPEDSIEYLYQLLINSRCCMSASAIYSCNSDERFDNINENNEPFIKKFSFNDTIYNLDRFKLWSLCSKLYEKKLFNELDIYGEDIYCSEDLLTNYLIYKNTEIVFSSRFEYVYVKNSQSIMNKSINSNIIESQIFVYSKILEDLKGNSVSYSFFAAQTINCYYDMLYKSLLSNIEKKYIFNLRIMLMRLIKYLFAKDNRTFFSVKRMLNIVFIVFFPYVSKAILKIKRR